MTIITSCLKGFAVILGAFVLLTVVLANSPQYGRYGAGVVGMAAFIACARPFRPVWLGGRFVSIAVLCVAAFGAVAATDVAERQRQELAARNEAKLQGLRKSDPRAYLAELEAARDSRWESEFEALDAQGYANLVAERRRNEEAARKAQITKLVDELKAVPSSDIGKMLALYVSLNTLEPTNPEYKRKREAIAKQADEAYQKKQREAQQLSNPERFVALETFSWSKGGFGSVMQANFTIKNTLPWPVKDIEVRCEHDAPSGTTIDSNSRTIYERIDGYMSKRISNFNMGFIHSQATRSGCRITKVVAIR